MEGVDRKTAAETCGMDLQTLRDWVYRYNAEGLEGLTNRRSAGPAPCLSQEQKAELAQMVREGPDPAVDGVVRWRHIDLQRGIEERFGVVMHERSVGKHLVALGFRRLSVRPQHPKSDPQAQAAFKKLCRDSSRRPPGTRPGQTFGGVVPRVRHGAATGPRPMADARVGQQGTLTRIWAGRGTRPRAPCVTRYTWACIFGAVCPEHAVTAAPVMPNADTPAMNAHLAKIARTVAEGAHAIPVLDGAGWHGAKALCVPDNITLLPLPPYAPVLNPVENVWAYLRANRLAISVFETCEQIVTRCCEAWNFFANDTTAIRSITSRDYAKAVKSLGRWHYCWPCRPAARN
jgi:transposase